MSSVDYIPGTDEGFQTWSTHFADVLLANPGTYALTIAQCTAIKAAVDAFVEALYIATGESTRNKGTVATKDDVRYSTESLCRQYAMMIKDNAGITDEDKIFAGVRPINPDRQKIDCPQTPPLLNVLGNLPGSQTVVYADTTTPNSKKRPFGASELQLFMAKAAEADAPFSQAKFVGKFTRNPIEVDFAEGDDGLVATYYGRWASPRGEVGPLSLPISMRIAA